VEVVDHTPPVLAVGLNSPSIVEVDERAGRRSLRDQIARLERDLAQATMDAYPDGLAPPEPVPTRGGPRLLSLGELERVRDRLARRVGEVRDNLIARSCAQARAREKLERMLLEPGRYRYLRISNKDLGQPGCTTYESVPRLGLVGMLMGWWQVKVSSGCPLAT
jgi:hypothetical protein